ncbi:MAG: hypothetical protein GC153_07320 [Alphaproteobacteria bacterium]|nr:hypothetical protein [Alphaproteobacteria bacterium]
MASAFKALVRENVCYNTDEGRMVVPFGEYEIVRNGEDQICFKNGSQDNVFTLSLDALVQHLFEGRISLIGGRILPPVGSRKAA